LYDGEIAWVDSQIGRLFAELREKGISDNALIIVTSDHGEEFLEHGLWIPFFLSNSSFTGQHHRLRILP
jgi:arylsulfatase A-like enzyme